jgi:hypothetical protein
MPRECVTSNAENVKEQGIDCRARPDRGLPPAETLLAPATVLFVRVFEYRFRPRRGGTCRETHERGTQRKRPERDRQQERRRAASLDGLGTSRSGATSNGAPERSQEHHALPVCVRGEERRNLVVEERESGGAEMKCVGGEVEAAADDSPLELSGPVAAIAEPGEDRLEIRKAVDVRPGGSRKLLEEAESARDRSKLAFLEELQRTLSAP